MIRKEVTAGFLRVALRLSVFAVKFKLYHYLKSRQSLNFRNFLYF